jgi:hypothetical protein
LYCMRAPRYRLTAASGCVRAHSPISNFPTRA